MAGYQKHSHTSYQASKGSKETQCDKVYNYLYCMGETGATCDELVIATGIRHSTCSARLADLDKANRIIKTKVIRKTKSKYTANVWVTRTKYKKHMGRANRKQYHDVDALIKENTMLKLKLESIINEKSK